jgi:DNA-binding NtrC family response regulator
MPVPRENQPAEILVIDSEIATLQAVMAAGYDANRVHQATTLTQAVELLGSRPIAVVISEVVVNGDDMTNLLRTLKQHHSDVLSIMVSGMRDTPRLIRLINQAQVFRFLPKPIRPGILAKALESAISRRAEARRLASVVPAEVRVEEAATDIERTLSRRIGDYLARVKARGTSPA